LPGASTHPTHNRLVQIDITVSYLEVKATIGASAYPCFVMNCGSLATKIRKGYKVSCVAFLAFRKTKLFH
jgi:hypothetical protein